MTLEHLFSRSVLDTADVLGVSDVLFAIPLVASENDFVCIQNYDEITCICVTSKRRLVLADNYFRDDSSEASDHLIFRIYNVPLRRIRADWLEKMRSHLLRLIRLLLQHRRLELQDPSVEVNGVFTHHCTQLDNQLGGT